MEAFDEFFQLMGEFGTLMRENWNVVCGVLAGLAVFILEMIFTRKRPKENRKVKKAKELGHVAKGKRLKYWKDDPYDVHARSHATYIFEVDGKEYKYRYLGRQHPPSFAEIYYIHSPRHGFVVFEDDRNYWEILWLIIPAAVAVLVSLLLSDV